MGKGTETGGARGLAGPAHAQDRQNPSLEREVGLQSHPTAAGGGSSFQGLTASRLATFQWMSTQPKIYAQHTLDLIGLRKIKENTRLGV